MVWVVTLNSPWHISMSEEFCEEDVWFYETILVSSRGWVFCLSYCWESSLPLPLPFFFTSRLLRLTSLYGLDYVNLGINQSSRRRRWILTICTRNLLKKNGKKPGTQALGNKQIFVKGNNFLRIQFFRNLWIICQL